MCAEPIPEAHQHVVDLESRSLLCTCRPCYLLFTDSSAHLIVGTAVRHVSR